MLFTYYLHILHHLYEDDNLPVISNLHVQEAKFVGKKDKFGGKSFKKLNSTEFMKFVFPSLCYLVWCMAVLFGLVQGSVICFGAGQCYWLGAILWCGA